MATNILNGLRTYLLAQAGVTSVIASNAVYFGNMPQNASLPAVYLTLVAATSENHLGGESTLVRGLIQIDSFADDYLEVNSVAEAIRKVVHGYSGAMGSETVQNAFITDRSDGFDVPVDGSQEFRNRVLQQVQIHYVEEAATV